MTRSLRIPVLLGIGDAVLQLVGHPPALWGDSTEQSFGSSPAPSVPGPRVQRVYTALQLMSSTVHPLAFGDQPAAYFSNLFGIHANALHGPPLFFCVSV